MTRTKDAFYKSAENVDYRIHDWIGDRIGDKIVDAIGDWVTLTSLLLQRVSPLLQK